MIPEPMVKFQTMKEYQEFAHPKTREALRAYVLDGATARYLQDSSVKPRILEARTRGHLFTVMYFGTSLSLEEVSRIYGDGIVRERVRQLIRWTFTGIHSYASPEIQKKHPLEEIPRNKIGQVETIIGRGLRQGASAALVADLARKSLPQSDIKTRVGGRNLRKLAWDYVDRGLEIPYSEGYILSQEIRHGMKDASLSFEEVKLVWVKTSLSTVNQRLTREGLVLSLRDLVGYAGMVIRNDKVGLLVPILERAEIAIGHYQRKVKTKDRKLIRVQNYYYLRRLDLEKAIQALEREDQLKPFFENPLKQISGPANLPIPNTNELINKRGFDSLNNLSVKNGVSL